MNLHLSLIFFCLAAASAKSVSRKLISETETENDEQRKSKVEEATFTPIRNPTGNPHQNPIGDLVVRPNGPEVNEAKELVREMILVETFKSFITRLISNKFDKPIDHTMSKRQFIASKLNEPLNLLQSLTKKVKKTVIRN